MLLLLFGFIIVVVDRANVQAQAYIKTLPASKWIRYAQVELGATPCGERTSNLAEREMAAQKEQRNGLCAQDPLGCASHGSAIMLDKMSKHVKLHLEWKQAELTLVRTHAKR